MISNLIWAIVFLLVVAWLLGIGTGITLGNLIHILIVLALVGVLYQLFTGRRPPL